MSVAALKERVDSLGVEIDHIKRIKCGNLDIYNRPGQTLSLTLLVHVFETQKTKLTEAGKKEEYLRESGIDAALELYGEELIKETKENVGKHLVIEALLEAKEKHLPLHFAVYQRDSIAPLTFSDDDTFTAIAKEYGTPLFVHDENSYRKYGQDVLDASNAYGLTPRYAMKANPHRAVLKIFSSMGIQIDASSYYEVKRALAAGVESSHIQLTSQHTPTDEQLREVVESGVIYNATSLEQIRRYCAANPPADRDFSVRINPGLGSGGTNRTNVGGPGSSFGIWHEHLQEVLDTAAQGGVKITKLHSHIGSGSDWTVWQKVTLMTLAIAEKMGDVHTVNLGGGFKIDRMNPENSINLKDAFVPVKEAFEEFAKRTGRELRLEIEPGTYLAANSSTLLTAINDTTDTGEKGFKFLKIDASMTELVRPMMYGAKHPIRVLNGDENDREEVVVMGMCCESGDIFSPQEGDPEGIDTLSLPKAKIGDLITIMGAGAYGVTMGAKNYNARPSVAEVMIDSKGNTRLITERELPEDVYRRERD